MTIAPRMMLVLACSAVGAPATAQPAAAPIENGGGAFALAAARAEVAREALVRAKGVLEGWWALRDPESGLLPRKTDQGVWAPQDNAADLWPHLLLTAHATAPERVPELMAVMRREIELTNRLGDLPDWWSFGKRGFEHAAPDLARITFGAAEYAKDGLNPLLERLGEGPFAARARQLLDGIFERAAIASDHGPLPADDTEVNGDLLQALLRFHFLTGEPRYLELAERIGDAYALEVLPRNGGLPAHRWDFREHRPISDRFSLNDHGNEIAGGLAELFAAATALGRPSAARYEAPFRAFFDRLLEKGRNEDGLWHGVLEASTGKVIEPRTPDTWGYAFSAVAAFGRTTGDPKYEETVRRALRGLAGERYLEWGGADSFADSIEGALLLLNRFDEPAGWAWLDRVIPRFFAKQKLLSDGGTGIVEGWYGDGNYARTALMIEEWAAQGIRAAPWNEGLRLGAAASGGVLHVSLATDRAWEGRIRADVARHRIHLRLPHDDPRLNSWPEWWPVGPAALYDVTVRPVRPKGEAVVLRRLGAELAGGLPLALGAGGLAEITIAAAARTPPQEAPPAHVLEGIGSRPDDPDLLGWTALDGGERHAGEAYQWTGRAPVAWSATSPEGPTDATLWIRFGSKNDRRAAALTAGDRALTVAAGPWDGFRWIALDVPRDWWEKDALPVRLAPPVPSAGGRPAFVSALALRRIRPGDGDAAREARLRAALITPRPEEDPVGRLITAAAQCAEWSGKRADKLLVSKSRWEESRAGIRDTLLRRLGLDPLPERTPLNARTCGTTRRDGYRIERVVFESRPGFPVTANVYVPESMAEGPGPHLRPAVLSPVGHWPHSKAEPVVQARCIALAKLGYVVLTYDAFGQGERKVPGNGHDEYFRSILGGWNNLTFMVWDSIRSLDYLAQRPDVDVERIACTGASGGGLNTLYLAAVDDRVRVAAPAVYVTRWLEFLETRIGHCPCSHVPGIAADLDMGDVAGLVAPRPLLILAAKDDPMFRPAGAREAAKQARRVYDVYSAGSALEVQEFDGGHDFGKPMREAVYSFLEVHLRGAPPGTRVEEPEVATEPPESPELRCFPEGRVPEGAETVRSLGRAHAAALVPPLPAKPVQVQVALSALSPPGVQPQGVTEAPPDASLLQLHRRLFGEAPDRPRLFLLDDRRRLGAWEWPGADPAGPWIVLVSESAPETAPAAGSVAAEAFAAASKVLAFDPRGPHGGRDEHLLATGACLFNQPLLLGRARVLGGVLLHLARDPGRGNRPIVVVADGIRPSLVSLLAQIGSRAAAGLALRDLPETLLAAFDRDLLPRDSSCAGLLGVADIPGLIAAAAVPVVPFAGAGAEAGKALTDLRRRLR